MTKILVVDDEADLEDLIKLAFRKKIKGNEYEFFFAENGEQALFKLKQYPDIDIILTDINMPVMDGLTLLGLLSGVNPMLKAIVVSAYDDMKNIRMAMNLGAFDFICKPVDFNDMDITVEKTITHVKQLRHMQYLTGTLNNIAYQQSHLLRRPLANIAGLVEVLDELTPVDEHVKEIVTMLRKSCVELNDEFEIFITKGIPDTNG